MILIDKALEQLEEKANPIMVGMVGAGFMGRGVALQLSRKIPGIRLVAISNLNIEAAKQAYLEAGINEIEIVETVSQLENAVSRGHYAVLQDAKLICQADVIDIVLEVTGNIPFGAGIALEAIKNGKHLILFSSELDATVGPILKVYADKAGVIYTNMDGDQPGVTLNQYRSVKGMGFRPLLCGNIKGMLDHYRNPSTQEGFAREWKQKPHNIASYADGTKISFEQAVVANATGMHVAQRGMHGPNVKPGSPIEEAIQWYPREDLYEGQGIIDYVVGASPSPGVFVLAEETNKAQQFYLRMLKMGDGPIYCFYRPYHLLQFEIQNCIARAVLFQDATIAPIGAPIVEVISTAKRNLNAGEELDIIGGYTTYGLCENVDVVRRENLLPIGIAEGCILKRDILKDQVLTYDDVKIPQDRFIDQLRTEQEALFFPV
jgi:predicted homoserine dehydrogenase-like protein